MSPLPDPWHKHILASAFMSYHFFLILDSVQSSEPATMRCNAHTVSTEQPFLVSAALKQEVQSVFQSCLDADEQTLTHGNSLIIYRRVYCVLWGETGVGCVCALSEYFCVSSICRFLKWIQHTVLQTRPLSSTGLSHKVISAWPRRLCCKGYMIFSGNNIRLYWLHPWL